MDNYTPKPRYTLRDVEILYKNFSGTVNEYNERGYKYFNVKLNNEQEAQMLKDLGVDVKLRPPRDEYLEPMYHFKVNIGRFFNNGGHIKPHVVKIFEGTNDAVVLNENTISTLDHEWIVKADVSFTLFKPERKSAKNMMPFLDTIYVTVKKAEIKMEPNELDLAYAHLNINKDAALSLTDSDLPF